MQKPGENDEISEILEPFELRGKTVWVAGHKGMVGSAIIRQLASRNCNIVHADRSDVDLCNQAQVNSWVESQNINVIFLAAARVGGILANNSSPANFIYENLAIATNVIEAAHRNQVDKLLYLGSSCIYPRLAPQPLSEDSLLTGPLEPTNQWYAIAKIAGLKMCEAYQKQYGSNFITAMPTNLYGTGDNFDLESSHVIPALMRKIHEAHTSNRPDVTIWGSGKPRREFLHVDDLAKALVFLMENYCGAKLVNVGTGKDVTIAELANTIAEVVGFDGQFVYDPSKPDGTPRKLLDVSRISGLGWKPTISLREGLTRTYDWFLKTGTSNTESLRL